MRRSLSLPTFTHICLGELPHNNNKRCLFMINLKNHTICVRKGHELKNEDICNIEINHFSAKSRSTGTALYDA